MGILNPNYLQTSLGANPVPPPPTSALMVYALAVAAEANRKPRNRSEWEARFSHWQRPASETEEAEIEAKARRIARAMRHSTFLKQHNWSIVKQGSYNNNTNIRAGSDVDLCVCLNDVFFVDGPPNDFPGLVELGRVATTFTFDQYRAHIASCLQQEFGVLAVTSGTKAIHLHKDDAERIDADVVPAYTFQQFSARRAPYWHRDPPQVGVALLTTDGRRITNFPAQHYANGCAKNDRTGRRYKRVVRIIKRLRDHMAGNQELPQAARNRAKGTTSFLIESLVYNCLDTSHFQQGAIYDDVVSVLHYLSYVLSNRDTGATILGAPGWVWWTEVNGIKGLFDGPQAWSVADASDFVALARSYMGI